MKVWITKHTLTQGIFEVEAIQIDEKMIQTQDLKYFFGSEWHKTKEDAIHTANLMKQCQIYNLKDKIETIKNDIEKLEKIKF